MKKKALAILLGVVAALGIAAAGGYMYLVNDPEISFGRVKPVNPDTAFYFVYPSLMWSTFLDAPPAGPGQVY